MMAWVLAAAFGSSTQAWAHERADEKLPPPPVRLQVIAPAAEGPWLLRIVNEGPVTVRIAADIRLLSLDVRAPVSATKRRRRHSLGWARRAWRCNGPKAFGLSDHFPIARERVLDAGGSYVERFDPRLICFGKAAELLVPGAKVKPYFGWRPQKPRGHHMRTAPFVADAASRPRKYRPLRRLSGATVLLSHDAPGAAGPGRHAKPSKPGVAGPVRAAAPKAGRAPAPSDQLAARLTLTASPYADATHPSDIELQVVVHNTGQRPLFVALRDRMLSFDIAGPDGQVHCSPQSGEHKVPRDLFHLMHHGTSVQLGVMLAEICPKQTFLRPGLYLATPSLHAWAEGREYGLSAATGVATSARAAQVKTKKYGAAATLVRVRRGPKPFYQRQPAAAPKAAAATSPAAPHDAAPASAASAPAASSAASAHAAKRGPSARSAR